MDCRHPFKPFDQMMLDWCVNSQVPINILLTKSDKLKRGAASAAKLSALKAVKDLPSVSVQLFSSLKKEGVLDLSSYLNQVFEMSDEN
jgi:GTP-binding protein